MKKGTEKGEGLEARDVEGRVYNDKERNKRGRRREGEENKTLK